MTKVTIHRLAYTDQGTPGILLAPGWWCHTLELPWRDNQPNISCIPRGTYQCELRKSPRFGWTYHVTGVEGRSLVLIHSGNVAGDVEKEYKTHVQGCILLGGRTGSLFDQRAVLASRIAVNKFMEIMNGEPFELEVKDGFS